MSSEIVQSARLFLEEANSIEAVRLLEENFDLISSSHAGIHLLVTALYVSGQSSRGIDVAMQCYAQSVDACFLCSAAMVYRLAGDSGRAKELYTRALDNDEARRTAYIGLAWLSLADGHRDQAKSLLKASAGLHDELTVDERLLIIAVAEDSASAFQDDGFIRDIVNGRSGSYLDMLQVTMFAACYGLIKDAPRIIARAAKQCLGPFESNVLANVRMVQGEWTEAAALLEVAGGDDPDAAVLQNLAICAHALGDTARCAIFTHKAARKAPGNRKFQEDDASRQWSLGNYKAAAESAQRAISLGTRNSSTVGIAMWSYRKLGKHWLLLKAAFYSRRNRGRWIRPSER